MCAGINAGGCAGESVGADNRGGADDRGSTGFTIRSCTGAGGGGSIIARTTAERRLANLTKTFKYNYSPSFSGVDETLLSLETIPSIIKCTIRI